MKEVIVIVGIILTLFALIAIGPLLTLFSVNALFSAGLSYTFTNWFAVVWLSTLVLVLFSGTKQVTNI